MSRQFKYMKGKELVIFSCLIYKVELALLKCSTFVKINDNYAFPEMDNYSYFSKESCMEVMSKSLQKLFSRENIFEMI